MRRQALNVFRMRLLGAEVRAGHGRLAHAQGRHERGDARLGRRTSRRPTTSSARPPARTRTRASCATSRRDRPARRAQQMLERDRPAARRRRRLRRRRLERDRHVPRVPRRRRVAARRRRGRRAGRAPASTRASLATGAPGVLHGSRRYVLAGRATARSPRRTRISAGLDYPGVGPEHVVPEGDRARRRTCRSRTTRRSQAFQLLARTEGIIPALESSHAMARAERIARRAGAGRRRARRAVGPRRQGRRHDHGAGGRASEDRHAGARRLPDGGRRHADLVEAAVRGGATAIEFGIPYSDPLADGPTIQRAGQRSLDAGMTPRRRSSCWPRSTAASTCR